MNQRELNELRRKVDFLDRHEQTIFEVKDLLLKLSRDDLNLSTFMETVHQLKLIGQKIATIEAANDRTDQVRTELSSKITALERENQEIKTILKEYQDFHARLFPRLEQVLK